MMIFQLVSCLPFIINFMNIDKFRAALREDVAVKMYDESKTLNAIIEEILENIRN